MLVQPGDTILFIGDSITDAGRGEDPDGLGWGYVRLTRDLLWARHPDLDFTLENRGIGGNTIRDLEERWERDVLSESPDLLVISIGVNDVWRQLPAPGGPDAVYIDEFREVYQRLLDSARERGIGRFVLCEPTMIGEGRSDPHNAILPAYLDCVAELAAGCAAPLVPLNQAFWQVIEQNPQRPFTSDGVHPYSQGFMVMALALYETLIGPNGFDA